MLAFVPLLQGCPNKVDKVTETHKINEWVYKQMAVHYLWTDDLPDREESRMDTYTQDYFDENLRYRSNNAVALEYDYYGDRFSKIEYTGKEKATTRADVTEKDYDFGFLLSRLIEKDGTLDHMQVLYVNPGGPADRAGLRRGDAFDTIDDVPVTNSNFQSLLGRARIRVKILNRSIDGSADNTITLDKGFFYNYPILFDTIYEEPAATAYLLYNHFTDGDNAAGYARKLRETFKKFQEAHVENLILDLRYNGGGEMSNAVLLASLIAPADMLGKEFLRVEDNTCIGIGNWDDFEQVRLLSASSSALGGSNADIKNLYIITSPRTASASELVIHALRPVFRDAGRTLRVIGAITRGKNLGSITIVSDQYDWKIQPITMRVYNLDKVSGYETGLRPDLPPALLTASEYVSRPGSRYYYLPPFGDYESEALLNYTMSEYFNVPAVWDYSWMWDQDTRSRAADGLTSVPMVPERGLTGGVIVGN